MELHRIECLRQPKRVTHTFYKVDLPFEVDTEQFIEWLKQVDDGEITGQYEIDVTTMCHFGALYLSKQAAFANVPAERFKICAGTYDWFEHVWCMLDDTYFVDLTLKQFIPEAPKLAITHKEKAVGPGAYSADYFVYNYEPRMAGFF